MSEFYTYLHCKPDGTPFYVGKGCGKRSHDFTRGRNRHHKNITAKYGIKSIQVFVFQCDDETQALADEIHQIAQLRREGLVLANVTDGGEGTSGCSLSDETKRKLSIQAQGNKRGIGNRSRTGIPNSAEAKQKISAALKGRPSPNKGKKMSDEQREKIRASIRKTLSSPEARGKRSEAAKQLWQNPDYRAAKVASLKGNKSRTGQHPSAEERAKLCAAQKARWARTKAQGVNP